MVNQTTQLIVELLDRVSGPARSVANSLRGITRTVRDATGGPITERSPAWARSARPRPAQSRTRLGPTVAALRE